jgi:hypothetical protein
LAVKLTEEEWFIEVKMMRVMDDNGMPNENILTHILSPYPEHRSALTDCKKLLSSGLVGRHGIIICGYEYPGWPLEPVISAFELLAARDVNLSSRKTAFFSELVHPIHRSGAVFGWELRQ